jgi:hypothetical protein
MVHRIVFVFSLRVDIATTMGPVGLFELKSVAWVLE